MKHETRFCTAPDGVGLAYAIEGDGPPLVRTSTWLTHLVFDRQSPVWRHWVRELSRAHTLVRYDDRGCGLSDREFEGELNLDVHLGDLEAVVAAAGVERFALIGISGGGPTAIEYAARNPDRVTRLILYGTYARGRRQRGQAGVEQSRILVELMRAGWGGSVPAFRQVFSSMFIPGAGEEQKRWYDEMQQVSSTGEMAARHSLGRTVIDVSDTARRVTQPTLVLHARHDQSVPFEEGRRVASVIPDARFVTLESVNHIIQEREPAWEQFVSEFRAFLRDDEEAAPQPAADLSDLSDREREVLELVAAGLSNEEIAERLFLSIRTVERHLSNVFVKLRLSGKSARAAAAARFSRA